MCLATAGKIIKIKGEKAIADFGGVRKEINVSLVKVSPKDCVMVHAGFAIEKIHSDDSRLPSALNQNENGIQKNTQRHL